MQRQGFNFSFSLKSRQLQIQSKQIQLQIFKCKVLDQLSFLNQAINPFRRAY
jgi:hypothetical protein